MGTRPRVGVPRGRRPDRDACPANPIGWILVASGLGTAVQEFAQQYAHHGLLDSPGAVAGADVTAWITEWTGNTVMLVFVGAVLASTVPMAVRYRRSQGDERQQLKRSNGTVTFDVTDDGVGSDPDAAKRGSGLQGIADRLAALGGELTIRSSLGVGTTILGSVPVGSGS